MKRFVVVLALALGCMAQMWGQDIWTNENDINECSSSLEITPDKGYVQFWTVASWTELSFTITYTFPDGTATYKGVYTGSVVAQEMTDMSASSTMTGSTGVQHDIGKILVRAGKYNKSASSVEMRVYFQKMPKDCTVTMSVIFTRPGHGCLETFTITDGSNITIVDPVLDTQVNPASDSGEVGQQKVYISSTCDITKYRWTDSENPNTVNNTNDTKSLLVLDLPPVDKTTTREVELYTTTKAASNNDIDWTFMLTRDVTCQPFHEIGAGNVDFTKYETNGLSKLSSAGYYIDIDEFKEGKRKYIQLCNGSKVAAFDPVNNCLVEKSANDNNDTSTLFTIVANYSLGSTDYFLFPYGYTDALGVDDKNQSPHLGGTYNTWSRYNDMLISNGYVIQSASAILQFMNDGSIKVARNSGSSRQVLSLRYYGVYPDMAVRQQANPDDKKLRQPKNVVRWLVSNIEDEDVMDGDQFVVQRATKADFSDATIVESLGFDEAIDTLEINGVKTGVFEFVDDDESALYNKNERGLYAKEGVLPKMYYRVMRATVYGMWPNNMGKYALTKEVNLQSVIPSISALTVARCSDWENDKRAVLTVTMANPVDAVAGARKYIWDENADIVITRKGYADVDKIGVDNNCEKKITIKGSDVTWDAKNGCYTATVEDALTYPYTYYYYVATIDTTNAVYPTEAFKAKSTDMEDAFELYNESAALVSNLQATQGEENGKVVVSWEAEDGLLDGFELVRQTYLGGSSDSNFGEEKVLMKDTKSMAYVDEDVAPDSVYQYTVRAKMTYRNEVYTNNKSVLGWASGIGTMKGQVKLANGSAMPGRLTVIAKRRKPLDRAEVKVEGVVRIKALHIDEGTEVSTECDENGCFAIEGLAYNGNDTEFDIRVEAEDGTLSFENSQGGPGAYAATLSRETSEYSGIIFTCKDEYRITGRVLYENSTVPVRDVAFKVYYGTGDTGYTLKDAAGENIVTNQSGNFDFYVPKANIRIQAYKEGHTMKGEGYIKNQNDEIQFMPSRDLAGLQIADQTKVRLIGRLCGGDTEGDKQVGFGLSKNNLGDDLTIVLQLEGDNTSQIVYHDDNPDNTTDKYTAALGTDTTSYTFEKKRIVIHPSTETGEFAVDLFPVKYKVTQLSAKGYSTLYGEGEGMQVVDLSTDSVMEVKRLEVQGVQEVQEVTYNAIYKKVYHAPVTVTYQQSLYGGVYDVGYIGEQKLKLLNMSGKKETYEIAKYDKKTGETNYTFGHPVFQEGNDYTLKVSAHEDYYYNGTDKTRLDQVALKGGTLVIANGMEESESGEQPLRTIDLDTLGSATFTFTAGNPTFGLTGDDALKSMKMQVDVNGLYYDADVLKGYVLGTRVLDKEALLSIDGDINILDVLRDPPGSSSYAYREAGTTYTWSYDHSSLAESELNIEGKIGYGAQNYIGFGYLLGTTVSFVASFNLNIPLTYRSLDKTTAEYTMTLSDRITTSSDPFDVGAMADVYIGEQDMYSIVETESFNIVDETGHAQLSEGIQSGAIKVMGSGKNSEGKDYWLVTGTKYQIGKGVKATFAYTQKHILGVIIPQMEDAINEKLLTCSESEAKALAQSSDGFLYRRLEAKESGCDSVWVDGNKIYYKRYVSNSSSASQDLVKVYATTIAQWRNIIYLNEKKKVNILDGSKANVKSTSTMSVAGTTVSHSEEASGYYSKYDYSLGAAAVSGGAGGGAEGVGRTNGGSGANDPNDETSLWMGGIIWGISLSGGRTTTETDDRTYYKMNSMGMGYELSTNNNGYFDVDIHSITPDSVTVSFSDKLVSDDYEKQTEEAKVHNFIFIPRGGAMRAPWFAVDTTVVYTDSRGEHVALGSQMLKIDNPKIYIDSAVVSNVPQDEKAILTLHLCNETEISDHSKYLTPTALTLYLDDASNPQGAKIYIDGMPITDGRQFFLEPGQSVTKTMEVVRGRGYDYENLKLVLSDLTYTLDHAATFSVHYMPESTPVKMTRPVSGWVINTLSEQDEDGYYLPVEIGGFDINYDGFDHIEMQYKKSTDGDDQWVNLCSFYVNDSLYQAASGEKQLITSSVINNFKFHGEKDPVEMKYDLRAVSFCRLGTGYVTKASEVMSGMKDTRVPRVFGVPKPSSGILTYEDVISLPFNEEIAYNYLDETANFQVQGYTNNSDIDESSYLKLGAMGGGVTKVDRNISMHDFTIDMLVRTPKPNTMTYPMIVGDTSSSLVFCLNDSLKCLSAWMNGREYRSATYEGVDFTKGLVHVGMVYSIKDSTVNFIVGDRLYKTETVTDYYEYFDMADSLKGACHANGPVKIQTLLGELYLKDIRLWNKALTEHEIAVTKGKRLTGTEPGLLCYWPLDETQGNVAEDKAGGADLYLTGTTWETPAGHSLRLEGKSVRLQHTDKFQRAATDDYTLSMWFKADEVAETGATTLLQAGQQGWKIGFEGGKLKATSGTQELGNSGSLDSGISLTDHSWHHLAITVSHTHNTAAFMFDGALVEQTQADSIGGFASDIVRLGSEGFKGNIDNLTFWHVALPVNYIKSTYNTSPSGKEMELQVYLPFTMNQKNDQGTIMDVFSPYNMVINSSGTYSKDTMLVVTEGIEDGSAQAPVRANSGLSNLPFTWTCTDTELQINIDKNDSEINHQQINVTVRGVEDLRGNSMAQPQMWTVYVDRNVLTWDYQTILVNLKYGEGATYITTWRNQSGRNVAYTIENNCSWLTIDNDRGEAKPTRSEAVTMTISDGLAPGEYNTVLYLIDENNLSSPLEVNLTVTADEPDWEVTTSSEYTQMMNLVGQAKVTENNQIGYSLDERDVVAAFCENVCVGKAYVKVKDNSSYVYMNIVGKAGNEGKMIDFYLWNASTNQTLLLDVIEGGNDGTNVVFAAGEVVGTVESPVQLETSSSRIQSFTMHEGWNWISLNVAPRTESVQNLFVTNEPFTMGDKFTTMNGGFLTYVDTGRGIAKWTANDGEIELGKDSVYQIYMQHAGTLQVRGNVYDESERYITLTRKGWNNMAYLLEVDQPINVAMSDYLPMEGGKAMPETVIKSRDAFAMAGKDGRWYGTLEYMHPGTGYYVRHTGEVPCRISYTNTEVKSGSSGSNGSSGSRVQGVQGEFKGSSRDDSNSQQPTVNSSAMPVVAMVEGQAEGSRLLAVCGENIVGEAELIEGEDGKQLFFITVNAQNGNAIRFAYVENGNIVGVTRKAIGYDGTTVIGTMNSPYTINIDHDLDSSMDIESAYDAAGRKIANSQQPTANSFPKGIYIVNGKKVLK